MKPAREQRAKRSPKRRRLAWFLIGLFTALCFVGPLLGALSALTWEYNSARNPTLSSATRILKLIHWQSYEMRFHQVLERDPYRDPCAEAISMTAHEAGADMNAASLLESKLQRARCEMEEFYDERVITDALERLPAIALGALEGCVGRSLLRYACEAFVERTTSQARRYVAPELSRERAEGLAAMHRASCLAFNGARSGRTTAPFKSIPVVQGGTSY